MPDANHSRSMVMKKKAAIILFVASEIGFKNFQPSENKPFVYMRNKKKKWYN